MIRFFVSLTACLFLAAKPDAATRVVTVSEGTNMSATVSPDGSTLVFDLQGTLWKISADGGEATRLTDPMLEPSRPDFSPRGDEIVFQAYKGGTFHLWSIKADGTGLRQLTDGHGDDRDPRFSPDGARIAFASDRAFEGSYDIWVLELAGGRLIRWTRSQAEEFEPTWSPDGKEIAFASGPAAAGTTIVAADAAGRTRTLIGPKGGARFHAPSWAPDGRLAYVLISGATTHLMVDGRRAGSGDDVFPFAGEWLPDGSLLHTGDGRIRVTEIATGATRDIPFTARYELQRPAYQRKKFNLDSPDPRPVKGIVGPALAPDGQRIAFAALNQIWVRGDDERPRAITQDGSYKTDPCWSPDGHRIAYASDRSGLSELYIHDLTDGSERRITATADVAEMAPAWSPDGERIAFQDQDGATFVLHLLTGERRKVIDASARPRDHTVFNLESGGIFLSSGAEFEPSKPSWRADGNGLAIAVSHPFSQRFREGTNQMLIMDLGTGKSTRSEPAPFKSITTRGEDGPVYSPDGTAVAFVMDSLLWIRPVDAKGVPTGPGKAINDEPTDAPTWSGDSRELLYLSNGRLKMIARDGSNLRTVPVDLTWRNEPPPSRTIIHAGRFWDGEGATVRRDVDIVIAGARIVRIEPHVDQRSTEVGTRRVDASALTVMPGLWEMHTHHWIGGRGSGDRLGRLWLAFGVTSLVSQGDPAYRAIETRESFASGARVGPRFFATGEALDGNRVYYNFMRPIASEAQLERELERAQALEYDQIKTYVRLPHEMQRRVVEFAHENAGVAVASHYMLPGMAYGMDGATHLSATARTGYAYTRSAGNVSYGDVRSLYAKSGMFVISTLRNSFQLHAEDPRLADDPRLQALLTPWETIGMRSRRALALKTAGAPFVLDVIKKERDTMNAIVRGGGIVLAGIDSPLRDNAVELHLNLRAQVKFGMKPWEALQSATQLAARAQGVGDEMGTLEPGKLADLAMVAGNPLEQIEDAAAVKMVMKGGVLHLVDALIAFPGTARP